MTITGARPARRAALAAVLGVLFLTFLDTTIVSVTLGDLESDVSAGIIPLQWVVNAYALVFASLMLVGGSLADRYGRKWVMLAGVAIFCIGSLTAALADGVVMVIVGRAVMGLGAAACEPGTLSVIRQLYPDRRERARALGAWSAVSGLALALGPVIGGLLIGLDGWRAVFWFNLGVGAILVVFVWRFVPNSRDPQAGRPDLPGFVLGTAAIGCAVYAAIAGEYQGYGTWWIIGLFALAAVSLGAFVAVEARVATPMLDLSLIRRPIVGSSLFAAFAVYFAVFALFFLTALYLDIGKHYSGWKLAGMFAPMAAAIVVGGLAAGAWVARVGVRVPTCAGCLIGAAGLALSRYEIGQTNLTFGALAVSMAVAGLGFGITVVPLTSAVLTHVPGRLSGMAASATNTARQLGAVVGVAALGAIANAHLVDALKGSFGGLGVAFVPVLETGGSVGGFDLDSVPDNVLAPFVKAFGDGLQIALLVAFVLMLLAGVVAALVHEPPADDADETLS